MRIGRCDTFAFLIYTRDHCPPHVHVKADGWNARFQFSFGDRGVRLWDVTSRHLSPTASLIEKLRFALKVTLPKAREVWWHTYGSTCLENQDWDTGLNQLASRDSALSEIVKIRQANYDARSRPTTLYLDGQSTALEIQL